MKKTILVIDDDVDIREVIIFALESDGFEVKSAENGKKGLDLLLGLSHEELPGLIIVDYIMPEMDGGEFIKLVKTEYQKVLGDIPLVISSAMGPTDIEESYFRDIIKLYKPMDLEDLLAVARKFCN